MEEMDLESDAISQVSTGNSAELNPVLISSSQIMFLSKSNKTYMCRMFLLLLLVKGVDVMLRVM